MTVYRFDITAQDGRTFAAKGESLILLYPNGNPPEWGDNPTIVQTDITQELADQEAAQVARDEARGRQKGRDISGLNSVPEIRDVVQDLIDAIL